MTLSSFKQRWPGIFLSLQLALWTAAITVHADSFGRPSVLLNGSSLKYEWDGQADKEDWQAKLWLSARDGQIWLLDPLWAADWRHARILVLEDQSLRSREETLVSRSSQARVETTRIQWPDLADERVAKSVPIPEGIQVRGSTEQAPFLVPFGRDRVWLIDPESRQVWRWIKDKWEGPKLMGEALGLATADLKGGLVFGTPGHAKFAFARTDLLGNTISRFGERIPAAFAEQDGIENSWVLTLAANGDLLAAQTHGSLLRRYDSSGRLLWQRSPDTPIVETLLQSKKRALADLRIDPVTACYSCKRITFASVIFEDSDGSLWLQYGRRSALDRFDESGRWIETVFVDRSTVETAEIPTYWQPAGIVLFEQSLLALQPGGLVAYSKLPATLLEGLVTEENGTPISGASVSLIRMAQSLQEGTSDVTGRFLLRWPETSEQVSLVIRADGFQEKSLRGQLRALLSSPIQLTATQTQCLRVADAATLRPIREYQARVDANPMSGTSVSRTSGEPMNVVNDEGVACLEAPWPLPWVVQVKAPGYAAAEVRIASVLEDPVELLLKPGAELIVTLQDPAQEPVAGAEMVLLTSEQAAQTSWALATSILQESDAEGEARWSSLAPGSFVLEARHPDFLVERWPVEMEEGSAERTFTLRPGATVVVKVTTESGLPIPRAEVGLDPKGGVSLAGPLGCQTDETGECKIETVPVGQFKVSALAESFVASFRNLAIGPELPAEETHIALRRGVRLTGVLHGTEAFENTGFDLIISSPGARTITAPVAANGSFEIEEVASGICMIRVLDRASSLQFLAQRVEIPEESESDLTLELPAALTISGAVGGPSGPCAGCTLSWRQISANRVRGDRTATTDGRGAYQLTLPTLGLFSVEITGADGAALLTDEVEIRGSTTADFQLSEAVLSGRVLTEYGEPAADAQVQVLQGSLGREIRSTAADSYGRFRFTGLPNGELDLIASSAGAIASKSVTWSGGDQEETLRLPSPRAITLRLLDEESELPLAGANILVSAADGSIARFPSLRADAEGVIEIPGLEEGPFTVALDARGYGLRTLRGLVAGDQPVPVYLRASVRSFTVEVGASSGEPCSLEMLGEDKTAVALSNESPPGPMPFTSRVAMFNGFAPGDYFLVLHFCDGRSQTRSLGLEVGATPHVVF